MGIIQRQALRTTLIYFAGAAFGGIVRVVLMPLYITQTQIGLLHILDSISAVFVTLFGMGYEQILVKLFPKYRDAEKGHHGFFLFGVMLSLLGIAISFVIYFFFQDSFVNEGDDLDLFKRFGLLIFPMIFFRIIFLNIDHYARMLFNTILGVLVETLISKFIIAFALIGYVYMWFTFDELVYLYVISFCVPGVVMIIFAWRKTDRIVWPHRTIFERKERANLYQYILYGLLLGASGSLVLYIDSLMLAEMMSLKAAGIYGIFFIAARFIQIPARSIGRIAQVILAESWQKKDMENIRSVYEKSCVNQLLIASYMLGVGWACLDAALSLSPKLADYAPHQSLFLLLGFAITVDMATGVNGVIIGTSPKYKYLTYFHLGLAVLVIVFNYFLITSFDLLGAAIASLLAMGCINVARWYFLYKTFNLQPFNFNFFKAFLLSAGFITLCHFADYNVSPLVKIPVNVVVLTLLFWGLVVVMKLSPDVNNWLLKMKNKFFTRR